VTQATAWNLVTAGPSRIHLRPEHLIQDQPVVTVNRAIDIIDLGLPVHFAAFADGPDGVWGPLNLERYIERNPTLQIWATMRPLTQKVKITRPVKARKGVPSPGFLRNLMKAIPEPAYGYVLKFAQKYIEEQKETFEVEAPTVPLIYLWDRVLPASTGMRVLPHGLVKDVHAKVAREAFTTLCALDRIWMFRPKLVRILCADMAGPWVDGMSEEECHDLEKQKVTDGKCPVALDRWAHERHCLNESIELAKKTFGVSVEWVRPEPTAVAVS